MNEWVKVEDKNPPPGEAGFSVLVKRGRVMSLMEAWKLLFTIKVWMVSC